MIRAAVFALATLLTVAGAASAQQITTGDGRQLQIPISPEGCTVTGVAPGAVLTTLKFACQVPDVGGGDARAEAMIEMGIVDASQLTAQTRALLTPNALAVDFLTSSGRQAQVGDPNFDAPRQIRASNGSVGMRCISYDHIEELDGHALCMVDGSTVLLMIYSDSTMALTAMRGVEAVMTDATFK